MEHPRGRHKARVFASALDITSLDAGLLREALLQAAAREDAIAQFADEFGTRYIVDFDWMPKTKVARIRSAWLLPSPASAPHFIPCFVLRMG